MSDVITTTASIAQLIAERDDWRGRAERAEAEAARLWKRVQSLEERRKSADEIISDAIERFSYLFDVWRDSKSNEEIAEGLRNFLQEWPATRERYCDAHSVLSVFQGEAADLAQRLQEEQARAGRMEKAITRYLELSSECDYVGGEPEVCPGIAEKGGPCHWCELRAALQGDAGKALLAELEAAPRLKALLSQAAALRPGEYDDRVKAGPPFALERGYFGIHRCHRWSCGFRAGDAWTIRAVHDEPEGAVRELIGMLAAPGEGEDTE